MTELVSFSWIRACFYSRVFGSRIRCLRGTSYVLRTDEFNERISSTSSTYCMEICSFTEDVMYPFYMPIKPSATGGLIFLVTSVASQIVYSQHNFDKLIYEHSPQSVHRRRLSVRSCFRGRWRQIIRLVQPHFTS